MNQYKFIYSENESERLDLFIAKAVDTLTRSNVKRLIEADNVLVNQISKKANHRLIFGDEIEINIPKPKISDISAQDIPLEIIYEDSDVIVINKPAGLTVHPAPGNEDGTLVNAILAHADSLSGIGGVVRPGIVHRIDKDTSGLLVVAKNDAVHLNLQNQIQSREAKRRYKAVVWGETTFTDAEVDAPIGRHPTDRQKMAVIKDTEKYKAREARTFLHTIERFNGFSFLDAALDTGRTHQIRVHCAFIGHPVIGDPVYCSKSRALPSSLSKVQNLELSKLIAALPGQALHAYSLTFTHPVTGKLMSFETQLPDYYQNLVDYLKSI